MQAHQSSDGTPRKKKTPADRAAEFAAVQVRLKHEAAARRAAAPRPAEGKSTKHVARGRQRSGR
jgi:hypothetical protein